MKLNNPRQSRKVDDQHDVPVDGHGDSQDHGSKQTRPLTGNASDDDAGPRRSDEGHRNGRGILTIVAVVGATAAIAAAIYFVGWSSSPGAGVAGVAGVPGAVPSSSVQSSGHGKGNQRLPGLPGGGDGVLHLVLAGKVLAVNDSSITIGGNGSRPVKAAFASSTKFTGRVINISGIKIGDKVYAQVIGASNADLIVATIRDPSS